MKQSEFKLKVRTLKEIGNDNDWVDELIEDGYNMSITAWSNDSSFMIDSHITEEYPELTKIDIEELAEGDMYYNGMMNKDSVILLLEGLGFKTI